MSGTDPNVLQGMVSDPEQALSLASILAPNVWYRSRANMPVSQFNVKGTLAGLGGLYGQQRDLQQNLGMQNEMANMFAGQQQPVNMQAPIVNPNPGDLEYGMATGNAPQPSIQEQVGKLSKPLPTLAEYLQKATPAQQRAFANQTVRGGTTAGSAGVPIGNLFSAMKGETEKANSQQMLNVAGEMMNRLGRDPQDQQARETLTQIQAKLPAAEMTAMENVMRTRQEAVSNAAVYMQLNPGATLKEAQQWATANPALLAENGRERMRVQQNVKQGRAFLDQARQSGLYSEDVLKTWEPIFTSGSDVPPQLLAKLATDTASAAVWKTFPDLQASIATGRPIPKLLMEQVMADPRAENLRQILMAHQEHAAAIAQQQAALQQSASQFQQTMGFHRDQFAYTKMKDRENQDYLVYRTTVAEREKEGQLFDTWKNGPLAMRGLIDPKRPIAVENVKPEYQAEFRAREARVTQQAQMETDSLKKYLFVHQPDMYVARTVSGVQSAVDRALAMPNAAVVIPKILELEMRQPEYQSNQPQAIEARKQVTQIVQAGLEKAKQAPAPGVTPPGANAGTIGTIGSALKPAWDEVAPYLGMENLGAQDMPPVPGMGDIAPYLGMGQQDTSRDPLKKILPRAWTRPPAETAAR